jgi:hypothetical protein
MMFLLVGCHKEDIRPNTSRESDSNCILEKGVNSSSANNEDNGRPDDLITDPNHDEDEDDQTKR